MSTILVRKDGRDPSGKQNTVDQVEINLSREDSSVDVIILL